MLGISLGGNPFLSDTDEPGFLLSYLILQAHKIQHGSSMPPLPICPSSPLLWSIPIHQSFGLSTINVEGWIAVALTVIIGFTVYPI
jgi:hypothetical protein